MSQEVRAIDANVICAAIQERIELDEERPQQMIDNIICLIYDAPTLDVEVVRHGYWIQKNAGPFKSECSVCRTTYNTRIEYGPGTLRCPHCGAKMDGQEDGK